MQTHLLCAVSCIFSISRNINLIKSQRVGYKEGYRTISDLIVNDNFTHELSYPLIGFDRIYEQHAKWNEIYIPLPWEQCTIYKLCLEWFTLSPILILPKNINYVLDTLTCGSYTPYVKASVAACGACRVLCHHTSPEIERLCTDILLFIKSILVRDIRLPKGERI